jgi:hypothetical protein
MSSRRAVSALLALLAGAGAQELPQTVPEASGFTKTSTHAEVLAFLAAVAKLPQAGARLRVETIGESAGKKPLVAATVTSGATGATAPDPLRVLINANIHGGEVEGKEASQQLIRDLVAGRHDDLLARCTLVFVPDFNPDGNDKIDRKNRVEQNGPDGGVGRRENGDGLDLNRDFVKLETSEGQALVALMRRFDPHLFLDLHTTNGSHHGYHVTYSRSLAVNQDAAIATASDALIAELRAALREQHGVRTFPYGNFVQREGKQAWASFDHTPRYATNYFALRNGIPLLCEAYSYLSFQERVRVTHAFVLETLRAAVRQRDAIVKACAAAAARPHAGGLKLGFDTALAGGAEEEVLVGSVQRVPIEGIGTRSVASPEFTPRKMPVFGWFEARKSVPLPNAWALLAGTDATRAALLRHGVQVAQGQGGEFQAEVFVPATVEQNRRSFQKHQTLRLVGELRPMRVTLPAGTWMVPADQPLALLAAQLLEALSEDSLATWNTMDVAASRPTGSAPASRAAIRVPDPAEELKVENLPYPVVRILGPAIR